MAKDIDEKIGAMSQKNWHGLKYKKSVEKLSCSRNAHGRPIAPALFIDI